MEINLSVTKKQKAFIDSEATEILFGGAAGGGKSHGQLIDALLYALKHPASKQLILRRTYPELEKSLMRGAIALYPRELFTLNFSSHLGKFKNGSIIDFGHCAGEYDVFQYQSAEYDVIRFDELTHFSEGQYLYLISRLRGANGYPKSIRSTTNPGGIGHAWVKRRFVDPAVPGQVFFGEGGTSRVFIPSRLEDNSFLTAGDPSYAKRLLTLPEREKKALLFGDWNILEGQYFSEFDPDIHVIAPHPIPKWWRKFRAIDYGLDRLVCLWIALDPDGRAVVYRELCRSDLPIAESARQILEATPPDEEIYATLAPPDLFARSQESGKSKATLFAQWGVSFTKTGNDRECGWLALKDMLRKTEAGVGLQIFSNCTELIACLPALQADRLKPTDCAKEPHSITHAPDALRGFAIYQARPARPESPIVPWSFDMLEDYINADAAGKEYLKNRYGEPKRN